MTKKLLHEDTVIIWNANPIGEYRNFLYNAMDKEFVDNKGDFSKWLLPHYGKTLKELVSGMKNNYEATNLTEMLAERRLDLIHITHVAVHIVKKAGIRKAPNFSFWGLIAFLEFFKVKHIFLHLC